MNTLLFCLVLVAAPADDVTLPGLENENAGLTKEQVLKSPEWRRTMLTLSTWFETQRMYSDEQVLDFKREINKRVRDMSPTDLLRFQNEITEKLAVLNGPAAQEVKTYLREQLSLASEAYRKKLLAKLPDVARMSVDEMQDYLSKFIQRANSRQEASQQFLEAKTAQSQMVVSTLNKQREEANAAINSAVSSGGWGGAGGVVGSKNVTGGQMPWVGGYGGYSGYGGYGGYGGWGSRW